jgi:hypothetical protein
MAGLTQKDFKLTHGDTRIIALIEKLIEGPRSPFTTVDGKAQPFNKITYPDPRSGRLVTKIATDLTDSADIATVIRTGAVPFKNIQLSYQRGNQVTNMVPLDQIMKTAEFGGRSLASDMTEIIYSAAVAQRFLNKNQDVVDSDVIAMLKMLNETDTHQIIGPMKSPNLEPKIVDDLYWEINSPIINIRAIKNPRHIRNLKPTIDLACRWANSPAVAGAAKKIYENSLYNRIDIKAVGSTAQNDTRIDVYAYVDKNKIDLTTSSQKQKRRAIKSSGTIDNHRYIWSTLFDFKIGPALEKKYFASLKSDGLGMANRILYKALADEFNRQMVQKANAVYSSMSDGVMQLSNTSDKVIDFPNNLSAKEQKIFIFHNLQTSLSLLNMDLKAVFLDNKSKPCIKFCDVKTGVPLVSLCANIIEKENYVSHHMDKGKLIGMLQRIVAP